MPKGKNNTSLRKLDVERLVVPDSSSPGYDADTDTTFYHQGVNPFCVRYCLASAFSYKGLTIPEALVLELRDEKFVDSLISIVQIIQKAGGWSCIRRLKKFNPFEDSNPHTVKVMQICAAIRHDFHCMKLVTLICVHHCG